MFFPKTNPTNKFLKPSATQVVISNAVFDQGLETKDWRQTSLIVQLSNYTCVVSLAQILDPNLKPIEKIEPSENYKMKDILLTICAFRRETEHFLMT